MTANTSTTTNIQGGRPNRPNRPLKIGYALPETEGRRGPEVARWRELKELAIRAEAVGFDSLWAVDRLLFPVGEVYAPELYASLGMEPPDPAQLGDEEATGGWECWSLMAALAAVTDRVELGQIVTNNLFRNPALLAKMADTVDEISGGRLILSLGAGDGGGDADRFGFETNNRVGRFAEALHIITGLLREGRLDYSGRYYRVREAELRPRGPRPAGPPILIGSQLGPRMLDLTARYADEWNTFLDLKPEGVRDAMAPLDAACEAIGRDPASLKRNLLLSIDLDMPRQHPSSTAYGRSRDQERADGAVLTGDAAHIAGQLHAYAEAGISHIVVFLEPDTVEGLEGFGEVLAELDRAA